MECKEDFWISSFWRSSIWKISKNFKNFNPDIDISVTALPLLPAYALNR